MDRLLTLRQSAEVMQVSYSKAQKLAKAGTLPFRKLGSTWMIPRSALYEALGLEQPVDEGGSRIA